jgi:hypothetical protein
MTREEILDMFRQQSSAMVDQSLDLNAVILTRAQLLADSSGRLSKENFEGLVAMGGVLYREGSRRYQGRSDIAAIMSHSAGSGKAG